MKIIITAKTKSKNPSEKELDESVEEVVKITNKIKCFDWIDCDCRSDGTSLILYKEP